MPSLAHSPQQVALPAEPAGGGIDRYFQIFLYLMVVAGFITLATTGALDLPTLLLVSAALAFRGYLLGRRHGLQIPEGWTNLLTIAYLFFYLADYFFLSGQFLNATVHLVLFVMLVRLYSVRRDRDYYFLAALAFLMVLAAAVLTVDSAFLASFAFFMLTAVAAFILMEMRHASAKASIRALDAGNERTARRMAFTLAGMAPVIVLLILLGGAIIFFILPRVSAGYLSAYAIRDEVATGFSERVELGRIGQIQQSRAVAMHVQIDGDNRGKYDLKLRGVALSLFDGRDWQNPGEQFGVPRLPDGRFVLPSIQPKPGATAPAAPVSRIHYTVLMEPVGSNVFFLALTPQGLQGDYRHISMDSGGAVYDLDVNRPVGRYEAWSDIGERSADQLRAASRVYPRGILLRYLQFPALDPRIPRLAQQITAKAGTNYDKAAAVETYLLTHYGYTLQLSRSTPSDPLAEFLFTRKQGHCEYFASSMAIMLRTLGIPTRVVNGFRLNEFNDLTSQYVVRDSDAHSWVEVYFPDYGWVSFDPTPAGPTQAYSGWSRMLLYADAMESFWREWVINYDVSHQVALGQGAVRSGQQWILRLRNSGNERYEALLAAFRRAQARFTVRPTLWSFAIAMAAILLLLAFNARPLSRLAGRLRLARHPEKSPRRAAEIWYARMIQTLARSGWPKPPTKTPQEFLAVIDNQAVRARVAQFTEHYEWARFGGSAEHAQQLPELHDEIVTSARR